MLRTEQLAGPEGCLRRAALDSNMEWMREDEIVPASLTDILRVHEYAYIEHLEKKVKQSAGENQTGGPPFYAPKGYLDIDTPLSANSLNAAKRFCGGAMLAVDEVLTAPSTKMEGGFVSVDIAAFVIGRPPGHHAGPHGCVPPKCYWERPDMTSSGFCLLNSVAIAAAHARNKYSVSTKSDTCGKIIVGHPVHSRPLRIAIVDIDVHHGMPLFVY